MHMAGTLEHTAPETFPRVAADGTYTRDKYSQAADLWAVGAIFFQARPSRVCESLLRLRVLKGRTLCRRCSRASP